MVNARSGSKEVYVIKGLVRWVERLDKGRLVSNVS